MSIGAQGGDTRSRSHSHISTRIMRSSTQDRTGRHIISTPPYVQKEGRNVFGNGTGGRGRVRIGVNIHTRVGAAEAAAAVAPSAAPIVTSGGGEAARVVATGAAVRPSLWCHRPWEGSSSRDGRPSHLQHEFLDGGLQHRICRWPNRGVLCRFVTQTVLAANLPSLSRHSSSSLRPS